MTTLEDVVEKASLDTLHDVVYGGGCMGIERGEEVGRGAIGLSCALRFAHLPPVLLNVLVANTLRLSRFCGYEHPIHFEFV